MRKITILFAMAAIVTAVSSCNQERFEENNDAGTDVVSFVLKNVETRSAGSATLADFSYRLGTADDGTIFDLEETVTDLYALEPETKGTPAYTENFAAVYGSFSGLIKNDSGTSVAGDGTYAADGSTYRRVLGFNPWLNNDKLTFYFRAPSAPAGVSNLEYGFNTDGDPTIEFDYTSPTTATAQQDILFASRQMTEAEYQRELASDGGAGILFRHALTGVKFAIGNNTTTTATGRTPSGQVETFITKVVIKGLKNTGHATFVPAGTETTSDNRTEYSSDGSFVWEVNGTSTGTFTQTYTANDIQDFESGDAVGGPSSFYSAGADRNLNKANASLTFWFVPQDITEDVTVDVTFYVWDGAKKSDNMTLELDLGTRIMTQGSDVNSVWKAGQLRTFKLKPTTVDVEITDKVEGKKKSEVVTKNTGNKDAYLRVVIVGNWVNNSGQIVAPWDDSQGTFVGLGGNGEWAEGDDGFWYYKHAVAPGEAPAVPIFTSYTAPSTLPEGATKLIMDISVQAVDVAAGSNWSAAWSSVFPGDDGGVPSSDDDDTTGNGD